MGACSTEMGLFTGSAIQTALQPRSVCILGEVPSSAAPGLMVLELSSARGPTSSRRFYCAAACAAWSASGKQWVCHPLRQPWAACVKFMAPASGTECDEQVGDLSQEVQFRAEAEPVIE